MEKIKYERMHMMVKQQDRLKHMLGELDKMYEDGAELIVHERLEPSDHRVFAEDASVRLAMRDNGDGLDQGWKCTLVEDVKEFLERRIREEIARLQEEMDRL